MTHLTEDLEFFLILAGGGSVTALAISRAKYGDDWYDAWIWMTKVFVLVGLAADTVNESRALHRWWAADPILASGLMLSLIGWGLEVLRRLKSTHPRYVDLELTRLRSQTAPENVLTWPLLA